jgi:hypothetical protein
MAECASAVHYPRKAKRCFVVSNYGAKNRWGKLGADCVERIETMFNLGTFSAISESLHQFRLRKEDHGVCYFSEHISIIEQFPDRQAVFRKEKWRGCSVQFVPEKPALNGSVKEDDSS